MKLSIFFIVLGFIFYSEKGYTFSGRNAFQDSVQLKPKTQQRIWLNGGQLARKEIQLSYERDLMKGLAAEIGFSYKLSSQSGQYYSLSIPSLYQGEHYDFAERMPFSKGILGSLAFKTYTNAFENKGNIGPYISGQFFYRYRFYKEQFVSSEVMASGDPHNWTSLQSLDLHIFGGKLLFGRTIKLITLNNTSALVLDFYSGFGVRKKEAKTTFLWRRSTNPGRGTEYVAPGTSPPNYQDFPPFTVSDSKFSVSVQLGFKFGYQF